MNEKFFPELARRLWQEGVTTGPAEEKHLPVLVNGQEVMWVDPQGCIVLAADAADDSETAQIYETVRDLSFPVYEYTGAMASAPVLKASGLHGEYRLLAEYNGVVLAGQEMERNWGYQFVTWRRNPDGASLDHGNYYIKVILPCAAKFDPRYCFDCRDVFRCKLHSRINDIAHGCLSCLLVKHVPDDFFDHIGAVVPIHTDVKFTAQALPQVKLRSL